MMSRESNRLRQTLQYIKKQDYDRAEELAAVILEDEPENEKALGKIVAEYKAAHQYDKAEELIQKMLARNPDHILALQESAGMAFEQGHWTESIRRYLKLQEMLDQHPGDKNQPWLEINKIIIKTLLTMKKYEAVKKQRRLAFEKLHGKQDLLEALEAGAWSSAEPVAVRTEMFIKGQASFYTCLHVIAQEDKQLSIVEKCLSPDSREPQIYRAIAENQLFQGTLYAKTPGIRKIKEKNVYTKLYLDYIRGEQASLKIINPYRLGAALGEIAVEMTAVLPHRGFEMKPVKVVHIGNMAKRFISQDSAGMSKILRILEKFNAHVVQIQAMKKDLPQVFSHNDIAVGNVLLQKNKNEECYFFIDWEKASYNTIGSDLGGILKWSKYKKIEQKGKAEEIETELLNGYYSTVSSVYPGCSIEDLSFSYYLHFITSGLSATAISHGDFSLLQRIANRCQRLLNMLGCEKP